MRFYIYLTFQSQLHFHLKSAGACIHKPQQRIPIYYINRQQPVRLAVNQQLLPNRPIMELTFQLKLVNQTIHVNEFN